jgi:hypothetical protein
METLENQVNALCENFPMPKPVEDLLFTLLMVLRQQDQAIKRLESRLDCTPKAPRSPLLEKVN